MALITAIALRLSRFEYSRYEAGRDAITLRAELTQATGVVDDIKIAIKRKSDGFEMYAETVHLDGDYASGYVHKIYIASVVDSEGIAKLKAGQYIVEVSSVPTPTISAEKDCIISIITVEQMRKGYCFGADLIAADVLSVMQQPSNITGVTVERVSRGVRKGAKALVYVKADNTLSYDGGPASDLDPNIEQEFLPDLNGEYIEVQVDHFLLPDADKSDVLVIDQERMDDDFIRGEISKSISEVENIDLKIFLEPHRVATEPFFSAPEEGEFFDQLGVPGNYYQKDFNRKGKSWHLSLPLQALISVSAVEGYLDKQKALELKNGAFETNEKMGTLDVIPYGLEYTYLYTFFVQINFWGMREYIENFWRYKAIAGFRKTPDDVIKLIGFRSAISILTVAGQAYRAGYASESTTKDGVTQSVSYTSSATFGIYSATIGEHSKWIKANLNRIKKAHRGFTMTVI